MAVQKNSDGTVTRKSGGGRPGGSASKVRTPGTAPGFPTAPGGKSRQANPKGTPAPKS